MLLSPQSFRLKVRCGFTHDNTSGVALLQQTETRLSGARMQRLLSHAVWDTDGVRDELRADVLSQLGRKGAIGVLDETCFPKRGRHSAGVGRQYCGATGEVEHCQVGVFLGLVTNRGHALIDREWYPPKEWCEDQTRREEVGIPETVHFQTKPELARELLLRLMQAQVRLAWVVADTVYGSNFEKTEVSPKGRAGASVMFRCRTIAWAVTGQASVHSTEAWIAGATPDRSIR